jgi:ABC-type Na+ efflux pump permease subunit
VRLGGVIFVVYILVGVLVALSQDYFTGLRDVGDYLEALIAILIWPAILLGLDVNIGGAPRQK